VSDFSSFSDCSIDGLQGMLMKALEYMSQLVAFQWTGSPYHREEVSAAIASLCPQLRELVVPS
jgi:hypothetical protein